MNVLHLIARYAPAIGGAEAWCAHLCRHLAARGHGVQVLTLRVFDEGDLWGPARFPERTVALGPIDRDEGVRIQRCALADPAYGLVRLGQRLGVDLVGPASAELLAQAPAAARRADVIHVHHPIGPTALAGIVAARLTGRPLVLTPHYHPGDTHFDQRATGWFLRRADVVVTDTPWEASLCARRGVAAERIVIAGTAIAAPPAPDPAARARVRARLGLSPATRVVTFLGRKSIQKSIPVLCEAVARIATDADLALVLVGPATPWFARERASWTARGFRLIDVPAVPEAGKWSLLAASDVLVQPSAREAFGLVFLEAWAAGVPVIGAAAGALPQVIGDGGLTFTPGDTADLAAKLAHLLANPAEGRAMAARGAARVAREHTPEVVGTRVEAAYGIALDARR